MCPDGPLAMSKVQQCTHFGVFRFAIASAGLAGLFVIQRSTSVNSACSGKDLHRVHCSLPQKYLLRTAYFVHLSLVCQCETHDEQPVPSGVPHTLRPLWWSATTTAILRRRRARVRWSWSPPSPSPESATATSAEFILPATSAATPAAARWLLPAASTPASASAPASPASARTSGLLRPAATTTATRALRRWGLPSAYTSRLRCGSRTRSGAVTPSASAVRDQRAGSACRGLRAAGERTGDAI